MSSRRGFRPLAVSALAAGLAAILVLALVGRHRDSRPQPSAPSPAAPAPAAPPAAAFSSVEFAPTSEGAHTAWLVAGPFEKPLETPERAPEAREGEALSGKEWKLLPWPGPVVELSDKDGTCYASGSLVSKDGGRRDIHVRATAPVRVWVGARLAGATEKGGFSGIHSATIPVTLEPGDNRVLVECSGAAGKVSLAFFLTKPATTTNPFAPAVYPAPELLALALRDPSPARLAALLAGSIAARPAGVWTEPGMPVELLIARSGSVPAAAGDLELRIYARPNAVGAPEERPEIQKLSAGELLSGPVSVSLQAPGTPCLALECTAELAGASGGLALARTSCLLYSRGGLEEEARRILATSILPSPGGAGAAGALALAHLKGEKARLLLAGAAVGETEARAALDELHCGRRALSAAAVGRDPLAGAVGWIERAYWSAADGSAQPYRLYVPRRLADPAERQGGTVPLIVYLHGYVPTYDKHFWVEESQMRDFCALAERFGALLLVPFGRSNSDFVSIGEVDVLRAIAETCGLYPVDCGRVSLCGYSMGGYGAYAVACHFPDRFSALAVLSGRPVPYYLELLGHAGVQRYKDYCFNVDMPLDLAPSLLNVPVKIFHNRGEFIPFDSAVAMEKKLKAAGARAELVELNGDHWSGWGALVSPETVGWMVAQRRPERPAKVAIRTYSPRFGEAYWARIDQIDKWTAPAELIVEDDGKDTVRVSARNVREFYLGPVPFGRRVVAPDQFEVDCYTVGAPTNPFTARGRLKGAPKSTRIYKGPRLPGPMKEACNGPFVVVWGSAGSGEETAENEAKARRFASEWQRFAKGLPQAVDEKTLTAEEKGGRSLIVFGTPETSALVREAAGLKALECRVSRDAFEVAGRKVDLTPGRGLVLTRPSPWAERGDRYLVVCAGAFYGGNLSENHKLDLIPDFVVFGPGREGVGEPPALLAGYFDSDWKADPALVDVFEPKPAAPPADR